MKVAMYLFLNKGLGMSTGKSAAQAGHAAVEAALISEPRHGGADSEIWDAWRRGLHYAKYVMEARDSEHLCIIERYLNDRGFRTVLIIDEGHTEVPPLTPTALGVALVDKDDPHTQATFSSFKLYKDSAPDPPKPETVTIKQTFVTPPPDPGSFVWGDNVFPFDLQPATSPNQCSTLDRGELQPPLDLDAAREERRSRRLSDPSDPQDPVA